MACGSRIYPTSAPFGRDRKSETSDLRATSPAMTTNRFSAFQHRAQKYAMLRPHAATAIQIPSETTPASLALRGIRAPGGGDDVADIGERIEPGRLADGGREAVLLQRDEDRRSVMLHQRIS